MLRYATLLGLLLLAGCESSGTTPVYVDTGPQPRVYEREPGYRTDRVRGPQRVRRNPDISLELETEPDYDNAPRPRYCATPDDYDSEGRRCGRRAGSYRNSDY